jgi:hypothetical protein
MKGCLRQVQTRTMLWMPEKMITALYGAVVFSTTMQPPFSGWAQFTVTTGKRSEHPRGMQLVTTRMLKLQASMRENQWHPRV